MIIRLIMVSLLLHAVPAICATTDIYKWVDEKGQVGYADDLGKVPKKYRDKAFMTEKQEQAVEVIEKSVPENPARKEGEKKDKTPADKEKNKGKALFEGKEGAAWKQDFAGQKYEIKSLEQHAVEIKERMTDGSKISRGEYLTLQNTQRDLDVRIAKAKKKLDAMNEAADKAELPADFR